MPKHPFKLIARSQARKFGRKTASSLRTYRKPPVAKSRQRDELYGDNWDQVSRDVRERAGWTCFECGWRPRKKINRKFLHAHHRQSVRRGGRNTRSNLDCVCLGCHAKDHPHMQKLKQVLFFNKNKDWL